VLAPFSHGLGQYTASFPCSSVDPRQKSSLGWSSTTLPPSVRTSSALILFELTTVGLIILWKSTSSWTLRRRCHIPTTSVSNCRTRLRRSLVLQGHTFTSIGRASTPLNIVNTHSSSSSYAKYMKVFDYLYCAILALLGIRGVIHLFPSMSIS
jgi:hypothetical protein